VTKNHSITFLQYAPSLDAYRAMRAREVVNPADWTADGLSEECLPVTITPDSGYTGWSAVSFTGDPGNGAALSGPIGLCRWAREHFAKVYRVSRCSPVMVREVAR
jgi:hypothetical protein